MKDLSALMKQAQAMQEKLQEAQAKLAETEVDGASGGGMVKVTLRGSGELKGVVIDEELLKPGEGEVLSDLIVAAHADAKRDISLKLDVDQFVRPISFRPGAITFEPAPGAPANLAGRLVSRLKEWTGQPWLVAAEGGGGAESAWERQKRQERETRSAVEADPFVRSVMEAFPGTEILAVRTLPTPAAGEVVQADEEADD